MLFRSKFTKQLAPLPTDAALHGLVKRGLNGTPMLPWALGDDQLDDIIQYLKYLSPEGQAWRDWFTDIGDPVDAGEDPWKNDEVFAIERGKKLYHGQANCASCHPGYVRVEDLPELEAALATPGSEWLDCDEWRTHFHVPFDLEALGGLGTTRVHADGLVDALLGSPGRWGGDELHLELETYTWDVLPGAARGAGGLVDGLEREYAPVLSSLARAGWRPA